MADIILKNANGTPQLYSGVKKINVPTSDGGVATYSEGSGGGGIEEVTELPQATAENVGKIVKYQGQYYEYREIIDILMFDGVGNSSIIDNLALEGGLLNLHTVDSEPNVENMLISNMETFELELYVLKDGTIAWFNIDGFKMTFSDVFSSDLCGVYDNFIIPKDSNMYLVNYYDCEPITTDINKLIQGGGLNTLILPKRIYEIKNYAFLGNSVKKLMCMGDVLKIGSSSQTAIIHEIDLSKTSIVPQLEENAFNDSFSMIIKVPQALLNDFKTATNWSELADYIVGV